MSNAVLFPNGNRPIGVAQTWWSASRLWTFASARLTPALSLACPTVQQPRVSPGKRKGRCVPLPPIRTYLHAYWAAVRSGGGRLPGLRRRRVALPPMICAPVCVAVYCTRVQSENVHHDKYLPLLTSVIWVNELTVYFRVSILVSRYSSLLLLPRKSWLSRLVQFVFGTKYSTSRLYSWDGTITKPQR